MKIILRYVLILVLVILLGGCNKNKKVLKVGAAIALTGFGADFGESERNAISLLKDKFGKDSVVFYIENTSSNVRQGIDAVKKLVNVHDVDVIYCELSSIVNATNDFIKNSQKILIAPVYLDDLLKNPYALRNLPSADQENEELVRFLAFNGIDYENIAILYSNDVFGQTCKFSFEGKVKDKKICYSSPIDDNNLNAVAIKVMTSKPDLIYIGSMSETLGLLIKYLKQNGYQGEILTTDAFSYDYINSLAGEYAKDVIYIDFKESEKYTQFRETYQNSFGKKCVPSAMLCYDGLSIVVNTVMKGKDLEGAAYEGLIDTLYIKKQEIIYPIKAVRWE